MRLLELFKGTGSIGDAFEKRGFEVVSVDIDKKSQATHTADVNVWDYKQYPPGFFDCIWASPPCTEYSVAKTTGKRDLVSADALVAKTLEIIDFFKPVCWLFENPGTSLLKNREVVAGIPFALLTYCKYATGDFPGYRKLTAIWNNLGYVPRHVCCKACPCEFVALGRHPVCAQRGPARGRAGRDDRFTVRQLYRMPPALCDELAEVCWQRCVDAEQDLA